MQRGDGNGSVKFEGESVDFEISIEDGEEDGFASAFAAVAVDMLGYLERTLRTHVDPGPSLVIFRLYNPLFDTHCSPSERVQALRWQALQSAAEVRRRVPLIFV